MNAALVGGGVVVLLALPPVEAPAHLRPLRQLDPQDLPGRERADLVVEAPDPERRYRLALDVALDPLWGQIEHLAVAQRAQQLDVLRMCPDQRHGAARRPAAEELA